MAFVETFDVVMTIKFDLQIIFNQETPIALIKSCLSFLNGITRMSNMKEKRLKIDLQTSLRVLS